MISVGFSTTLIIYFLWCVIDIIKIYPNGVGANRDVNFSVEKGEIHALVGENGAGKSTLMKILYGLEQPTGGQILLNGKKVDIHNTHQAIGLGIGMVHQNFMLVPSFTVAQTFEFIPASFATSFK